MSPCWLLIALALGAASDPEPAADWVLRGGTVIDGTGAPGRQADVAIRGDRIGAVGDAPTGPDTKVIDARGLVVAPGFIDLHTHSDNPITRPQTRANRNYQAQGVTTVVTGNCGSGPVDVAKYFKAIKAGGAGTNVIHLMTHGSIREAVMGNAERKADADSLAKMRQLVELGIREGAWGISTGLIYLPGRYADAAELIELSRVVARHGGIYASHIRDEGAGLLRSIDETLRIGREAGLPVHVSHLKATGKANWGLVGPACDRIDAARAAGQTVTADQYPYIASSTSLGAMVVPHWARQDGARGLARLIDDPAAGPRLRREIAEELADRDGGGSVRIARYAPKPSRVGKSLDRIAQEEGTTPVDVVIDIERNGGAQAISFGMSEDDVRAVMARPFVATASDGSAHNPGGQDRPHPRAYGTFPRKIRYALDEKVITLEQAVRSCSGLPAEVLGLPDRGTIRPGAVADLVVFDPARFRDVATFDDPTRYADGVRFLFVNGVLAIAAGKFTDALPGRVLTLQDDGPASLIVKVGRIWTGDPNRPRAEAFAARNGEIVAVGSAEEVDRFRGPMTKVIDRPDAAEAFAARNGEIVAVGSAEEVDRFRGPMTKVIDRPDAFAMPGLIDAHGHLGSLGATVDEIELRGVDSPEKVAALVAERIKSQPGDGWIKGRNWDQSLWPGGEFSTAAVLDAVAPDRPVWLVRVDGHAAWANSEAMRRAGIKGDDKDSPGGQIVRDATGKPTGVFVDAAKDPFYKAIPRPTRAEIERHILAGQDLALRAGLTGVHDAGVGPVDLEVYRDLDRAGKLKLRVYGMLSPRDGHEVDAVSRPPRTPRPGERFTMRAIKLFIDGAMGSRGGLLFEPYADDPHSRGLQLIGEDVLRETTETALRHGWQVCTHAIGDRGNALVLDAYIAALKAVPEAKDARLRVEHAQVVRKEDVARFAEWKIVASMQPSHASDDMRWADLRLGKDTARVRGAYAWRWFLDAGVPVAFGSDFPVEVVSPFWGLYAAVTRRDAQGQPAGGWHPDQLLSMDEALRAFTAGSAYAAFEENRLGVIRVGMRADATVVDRDLIDADPADVLKTRVIATVIDGEVVAGE